MKQKTLIRTEVSQTSKALLFSSLSHVSQFTVLDEDALSQLVSFFEDLLIVDVGHGGDEALE